MRITTQFIKHKTETMHRKAITFLLVAFVGGHCMTAQTITPSVINSAGMTRTTTAGWSLTDNVGEPFITTIGGSGNLITQGFLQTFVSTVAQFSVTLMANHLKCRDREEDASLIATVEKPSAVTSYTAEYNWSRPAACRTCPRIDTLPAGNHSVTVVLYYQLADGGTVLTDTVRKTIQIENSTLECRITPYKGVTPNADGTNDTWYIDNITEYPKNKVSVFNRWGSLIYQESGYNNTTKSFPKPDILNKLPASTYFYIIELGDGSAPIKGWLEIIKTN
jgi:gliding motility-associated-like protein